MGRRVDAVLIGVCGNARMAHRNQVPVEDDMIQQQTTVALDGAAVHELAARLRGDLVRPGDARYEEVRAVYNGMIDKRPAVIAQCEDVADVIAAVNFAREHQLALAVRGGGHSGPGLGTVDNGLLVDLSRMKSIHLDAANKTVRVEGGSTAS